MTEYDEQGESPLYIAIALGKEDIAKVLLEAGADIHQRTECGGLSVLHSAVGMDHISEVRLLLDYKADVNAEDDKGGTPLISSCDSCNLEIAELLVEYGADVDHQNKFGINLIFMACFFGNVDFIQRFLTNESANVIVDDTYSMLHAAVYLREEEMVRLTGTEELEANSGNQDDDTKIVKVKPDIDEWNFCYGIANRKIPDENRIEIVKLLLPHIKHRNFRNHLGETAFFLSCSRGMTELANLLYTKNVGIADSMFIPDYNWLSPLHTATINSRLETVKWLLSLQETNVNAVDAGGYSTLFRACEFEDNEDIIRALVNKGADVELCNNEGMTPISAASLSGNKPAVRILLDNKARAGFTDSSGRGWSALYDACEGGWSDIVKLLIEHGVNLNLQNETGSTALHVACLRLNADCVDILVDNGGDINAQNDTGETPLHVVCCTSVVSVEGKVVEYMHESAKIICGILMQHGANPNSVDFTQEPPLVVAVKHNNTELCDVLTTHGANVHQTGFCGRSLIHSAIFPIFRQRTFAWTLQQGIDINTQDHNGHTVLHLHVLQSVNGVRERDIALCKRFLQNEVDAFIRDKFGFTALHYAIRNTVMFDTMLCMVKGTLDEGTIKSIIQHAYHMGKYDEVIKVLESQGISNTGEVPRGMQRKEIKSNTIHHGNELMAKLWQIKQNTFHNREGILQTCEQLLLSFGRVCESDLAKEVVKHLDKFISCLCEHMREHVDINPVLAGSMQEGTRVVEASEGDYLFVLACLQPYMFETPENGNKSFVRLKVKPEYQHMVPQFITNNGYLSRKYVFNIPYLHVTKVLTSQEFWKSCPEFMRLSSMDVRSGDQSIKHLDLIYHDDIQEFLELDVDLTPAVEFPVWYPTWCRNHTLHQQILNKHGCRAVAKWLPEHQDDPTTFRLSLDGCGIELLKIVPTEYKETYKLAKILLKLCPEIDQFVEGPSNFIPSFHLKTQLFWIFFEKYQQDPTILPKKTDALCNYAEVLSLTRLLFEKLALAYQQQWLEDFWIVDYNILFSSKYGTHGWCAANYALIVKWFLEIRSQEGPHLISAADCVPSHDRDVTAMDEELPGPPEEHGDHVIIPMKRTKLE